MKVPVKVLISFVDIMSLNNTLYFLPASFIVYFIVAIIFQPHALTASSVACLEHIDNDNQVTGADDLLRHRYCRVFHVLSPLCMLYIKYTDFAGNEMMTSD